MIPLGVAMELPKGYEALVAPRSSTFKKYGVLLANSIGVIDESYCGDNDEWKFLAYATRDVVIEEDERICQFRIIRHQPEIEFEEVFELGNTDRGGMGSTDKLKLEILDSLENAIKGEKYYVICGNGYFETCDVVVALKTGGVPFCIKEELFDKNMLNGDDWCYTSPNIWAISNTRIAKIV